MPGGACTGRDQRGLGALDAGLAPRSRPGPRPGGDPATVRPGARPAVPGPGAAGRRAGLLAGGDLAPHHFRWRLHECAGPGIRRAVPRLDPGAGTAVRAVERAVRRLRQLASQLAGAGRATAPAGLLAPATGAGASGSGAASGSSTPGVGLPPPGTPGPAPAGGSGARAAASGAGT